MASDVPACWSRTSILGRIVDSRTGANVGKSAGGAGGMLSSASPATVFYHQHVELVNQASRNQILKDPVCLVCRNLFIDEPEAFRDAQDMRVDRQRWFSE